MRYGYERGGPRLYIGGSSQELERAWTWSEYAREAGFTVTSTFVEDIRLEGETNPSDYNLARGYADRCAQQVLGSEIFWMLMPEDISHGVFWEFGLAHGSGIYVVVSGEGQENSIFTTLGDLRVPTEEEALDKLVELYL